MVYMAKKKMRSSPEIQRFVTAGANVPVALQTEFNRRVVEVGLMKERAWAAAMQWLIQADNAAVLSMGQLAYEQFIRPAIAQVEASGIDPIGREASLLDDSQNQLADHRNSSGPPPAESERPPGGSRKAGHG